MELSNLVKHETARSNSPTEKNAERIRSSLARLSSTSIDDLEALTAELKRMRDFVKSEVDAVQRQMGDPGWDQHHCRNYLAVEKYQPARDLDAARAFRAGLAASIEYDQAVGCLEDGPAVTGSVGPTPLFPFGRSPPPTSCYDMWHIRNSSQIRSGVRVFRRVQQCDLRCAPGEGRLPRPFSPFQSQQIILHFHDKRLLAAALR